MSAHGTQPTLPNDPYHSDDAGTTVSTVTIGVLDPAVGG